MLLTNQECIDSILFYSFTVSGIINLWIHGEVAEWLKAHAWKACRREDCLAGSNPAFSAITAHQF